MIGEDALQWCRAQPNVSEERPFGPDTLVFKIGGRMFAAFPDVAHPDRMTLKGDPELSEILRDHYPGVQPGYHTNKRHWNTVALDGSVPEEVVAQLLADAYRLVARSLPDYAGRG